MKLNELAINIKHNDLLERYNDDWRRISMHKYLSEEFIEYYKNKLDWNTISVYQKLNEQLIEKYKNDVNWKNISKYQKLS